MERKLLINKKRVLKKMLEYRRKVKFGEYALQLVELNYDNRCNFACEHCFSHYLGNDRKLAVSDVRRLSQQADHLGVWQWHLQGGEPTIWEELDDILAAIDPEKFYTFITTNGYLMTDEKAKHWAEIGVDKVSVSLDSFDSGEHDSFRKMKGAHQKAMEALFHVKNAGMQANINTVITRQNIRSKEIQDIIDFADKNGLTILFVIATSAGNWAGKTDMLITEDDARYLWELKKKYPFIHRDLYPLFDFEWGCRTMNGLVYIAPNGDLFSCPFIHIKIGNVLEEPLSDILKRGWRVKYFRNYNSKCLAGEDKEFIKRFMHKPVQDTGVIPFEQAFSEEDLYEN